MPNYKPKGKELKAAKKVHELFEGLKKELGFHRYPVSPSIHIDFTLDGTRTNGHQAVTSLFDVKQDLESYKEDCYDEMKINRRAVELTVAMLNELDWFETCPKCKGEKGEKIPGGRSCILNTWEDCSKCNGRGILEIDGKRLAVKNMCRSYIRRGQKGGRSCQQK